MMITMIVCVNSWTAKVNQPLSLVEKVSGSLCL